MSHPYVSTTFFPDQTTLEDALNTCCEHGIHHLELGSNHAYVENPLELVRSFDIFPLVHNYFPIPADSFVMNIASQDATIRNRSIAHARQALDFAAAVGSPLYTIHPGFKTDPDGTAHHDRNFDFNFNDDNLPDGDADTNRQHMIESLDTLTAYAAERGVTLAIETQGSATRPDHLLMQTPAEDKYLFSSLGIGRLKINLHLIRCKAAR